MKCSRRYGVFRSPSLCTPVSPDPESAAPPQPFRAARREAFRRRPSAGLSHAKVDKQASQRTPWGHTPCVPCGGWRGAAPPLTPKVNPRSGSVGGWGPKVPRSASRRRFSRRRPIAAGRRPSASRLSPRSDRRAAWSASPPLRRRSPRPPARTLSVPPAGVESPPRPGRKEGGTDPIQTSRSKGRAAPAPENGRTSGRRAGASRGGRSAGLAPRARRFVRLLRSASGLRGRAMSGSLPWWRAEMSFGTPHQLSMLAEAGL